MITKKNYGFTLVELLVVVAIIAILSVIGLTLFTGAQQNARDARRKSDIDAIAAALESKRGPGSVFYLPIVETDFSSGSIPVDSTTAKYCIKLYTADDGAKVVNPDNTFGGGDGCPADVATETTWDPATVAGGFQPVGVSAVPFSAATTPWAENKKSWKLCAKLENTTASPNVYCKNSAQ